MINTDYRFDPVDFVEMRRWTSLSPTQRLETMLNARELAVRIMVQRGVITVNLWDMAKSLCADHYLARRFTSRPGKLFSNCTGCIDKMYIWR